MIIGFKQIVIDWTRFTNLYVSWHVRSDYIVQTSKRKKQFYLLWKIDPLDLLIFVIVTKLYNSFDNWILINQCLYWMDCLRQELKIRYYSNGISTYINSYRTIMIFCNLYIRSNLYKIEIMHEDIYKID